MSTYLAVMIARQTINEVSRRKSTAKAKLKAANQQERIKLWKQHFENLIGNPPKIISKQLDIKLGPFTQEELDSVLRKIRNRKIVQSIARHTPLSRVCLLTIV